MSEKTLETVAWEQSQKWLGEGFDEATRQEVKSLLEDPAKKKEWIDAFYKDIDFGTGGVRGVMGVGSNRINRYTLSKVTRGLIRFANKHFPSEVLKVAIACDTRNHSEEFSQQVAEIFAQSGAEVYRFSSSMPTPLLSYAVRHLRCRIGVVITASHNPKEYNGYKVYFDDGAQVVPPWDGLIIDEVNGMADYGGEASSDSQTPQSGKVVTIGDEVVGSYTQDIFAQLQRFVPEADLSIPLVFSSLHGTGGKLIIPLLKKMGFTEVYEVASQMKEDGNFPTVVYPNPEESEALTLGLEMMEAKGGEFLMATDPDADRLGVAVRDHSLKPLLLNGNQIGVLLSDFILAFNQKNQLLPPNPFLVRTVVTTPLIDAIAQEYGVELFRVLTGFKYIGEVIRKYEGEKQFVFGLEESHGYLFTDKVRDKDAVSSAILFALMAACYRKAGSSVFQRLCEIYEKYGFCFENLTSLTKTGPEGKAEILATVASFRENYGSGKIKEIDSERLSVYRDFKAGYELDVITNQKQETGVPSSDVIQLQTDKNTLITVRPSGTEPKIKFYFSVRVPLPAGEDLFSRVEAATQQAQDKIDALKKIFTPS